MTTFFYITISVGVSLLLVPLWADMLRLAGHLQTNYCGRAIPQSMGGIFVPVFLVSAVWAQWTGIIPAAHLMRMVIVTVGLGILGLIDDIWGDERSRGFGGHFRAFVREGRVTTGLLKAAVGFLVSLWAVAGIPGFALLMLWRAALVALSANLHNLLDLRPGRSLKGFFFLSLLYVWLNPSETGILLLFPFLVVSLVYFPYDLGGKGMLGDAGSNVLGAALGLVIVLTAPIGLQLLFFLFLVGLHVLAERISLTRVIAATPILRFLDNLGRHS